MTLPITVMSAGTPSSSCAPPRATRKPVITSSRTSSAPDESASSRSRSRNPGSGGTTPMFAGTGSARIAAGRVLGDRGLDRLGVVPGDDHRRGRSGLGDARRGRDAGGRQARPGLGEQAVDVAVVGAGELDELLASGRRAGQADRAHRRLGARARHPQHLDRREAIGDLGGQLDLALGGGAVAGALRGRRGDRLDDGRVGVAQDQRAPGRDPVDVGVAVGVPDAGALAALDEDRVAPDRSHRPDRGVDSPGHQLHRALVELRGPVARHQGRCGFKRAQPPRPRSRR